MAITRNPSSSSQLNEDHVKNISITHINPVRQSSTNDLVIEEALFDTTRAATLSGATERHMDVAATSVNVWPLIFWIARRSSSQPNLFARPRPTTLKLKAMAPST